VNVAKVCRVLVATQHQHARLENALMSLLSSKGICILTEMCILQIQRKSTV